jgi:hypothetical protein
MNRIEILFRLSDTADNLEAAGLFREAVVLTNVMKRMAEVFEPGNEEEPDYYYTIQNIKDYWTQSKDKEAQSIFDQYKRDMEKLIKIPNNPNKRDLEKRLKAMTLQVAKLNSQAKAMPATIGTDKADGTPLTKSIENNALANLINYYGLERATDLKDYNRRWKLFMDFEKSTTFSNATPGTKPVYYLPGMQQYFANLYEQLKLKYIK